MSSARLPLEPLPPLSFQAAPVGGVPLGQLFARRRFGDSRSWLPGGAAWDGGSLPSPRSGKGSLFLRWSRSGGWAGGWGLLLLLLLYRLGGGLEARVLRCSLALG